MISEKSNVGAGDESLRKREGIEQWSRPVNWSGKYCLSVVGMKGPLEVCDH